jgi:hypothetical protein
LLNERFRNADSPGIADAHQFDSHKFHRSFTSDYIVITLAPRVQLCSEQRAARSYGSWPLFDVRVFGKAALECSSSETRHGGRFFLRGFYIGAGLLGRRPSGCRNSALRRQMTSF